MQIRRALLLGATLAVAAPTVAQGVNCALLGTFDDHGPFRDVWGYVAPNGDEYALLATTTGTVVIDVTDPTDPVERGWFPWGSSSWRDIRTFGTHAYVVTEATAGFQVLDLSNPNNPVQIGIRGTANSNNAHNVCVDTGTGRLYLAGCNTGTPVYDLTASATNPPLLGFGLGPGNSNYFHDLCVENGYVYGSMIYNGVLRIVDAQSSLPWTPLSDSPTPGSTTHNAWPNAAGTLAVTTDEITGGVVQLWDISNKLNPQALGQFTPNPGSVPHNAYIVGDLCHVSWYTEGYRCLDISDPNNPVEIASYDTWPGPSGGFSGAWGCYPFLPSGNILVSDRSTGLYVVRPGNASLSPYGQGCPGSVPVPCPELNPAGGVLNPIPSNQEWCYRVDNSGPLDVSGFDLWTAGWGAPSSRPARIYGDAGGIPAAAPLASTTIALTSLQAFYTATFSPPVAVNGPFYIAVDGQGSLGVFVSTLWNGDTGAAFSRSSTFPNWAPASFATYPSWRIHCAGGGTLTPELGTFGFPIVGTTYGITLSAAAPSTAAFAITGLSDTIFQGIALPARIPGAPGCDVYASPDATRFVLTDGAGTAAYPQVIPNSAGFAGLTLFHQWAILDAVNPLGVVVSDAARAVIDL